MHANKDNYYAYNRNLQHFANDLRHRMTKAEACLWKYALRAGMRKGYSFRRQRPVLNFIADFMCKELKLVIEVDGITHTWEVTIAKDRIKDERLKDAGFEMLRFTDDEVVERIEGVIQAIDSKIAEIERAADSVPEKRKRRRGSVPAIPQPPSSR